MSPVWRLGLCRLGCPRLVEHKVDPNRTSSPATVDGDVIGTLSSHPDPVNEPRSTREVPRNPPIRQYQITNL